MRIRADYITRDVMDIWFWSRAHWYSAAQRIGYADWQRVAGIEPVATKDELAHELGVSLWP